MHFLFQAKPVCIIQFSELRLDILTGQKMKGKVCLYDKLLTLRQAFLKIYILVRIIKAAYSVTMNIFRKKYFLFKSFAKVE